MLDKQLKAFLGAVKADAVVAIAKPAGCVRSWKGCLVDACLRPSGSPPTSAYAACRRWMNCCPAPVTFNSKSIFLIHLKVAAKASALRGSSIPQGTPNRSQTTSDTSGLIKSQGELSGAAMGASLLEFKLLTIASSQYSHRDLITGLLSNASVSPLSSLAALPQLHKPRRRACAASWQRLLHCSLPRRADTCCLTVPSLMVNF